VSGIVSTLVAGHNIEMWGQKINDLPFALISPLHSNNDDVFHARDTVEPLAPARLARGTQGKKHKLSADCCAAPNTVKLS
jgi:hypothetical protein